MASHPLRDDFRYLLKHFNGILYERRGPNEFKFGVGCTSTPLGVLFATAMNFTFIGERLEHATQSAMVEGKYAAIGVKRLAQEATCDGGKTWLAVKTIRRLPSSGMTPTSRKAKLGLVK